MLDRAAILGLRDKATVLGARFDIRRFHDAVLLRGAVPQQVLGEVVGEYARAVRVLTTLPTSNGNQFLRVTLSIRSGRAQVRR